jgi:hypothetical protein
VTRRISVFAVCAALSACGGGSPSAPTATGPASAFAFRGETVNAIDGMPIGRVNVKIGSQSTLSDENGRFDVGNLREGTDTIVISGSSIVERQKTVTVPNDAASREALIPSSFDLAAFDEMFRGTGRLQRWKTAPALVVLAKVMQFESFAAGDDYHATADSLTDSEIALLIDHLNEGLLLLTGNAFGGFSSIVIESPAAGTRVATLRPGTIVVGRYRGVQSLANTIGFGKWGTDGGAEVTGGGIYLDNTYDRTDSSRRLLRIHELGHALGYLHVTTRASIMNPALGPEPTEFDRQGAIIAFQRAPGNRSPDSDLADAPHAPRGGIFGSGSHKRTLWSPPLF